MNMSEPEYDADYDPDDQRGIAELAELKAAQAAKTIREAHENGQLATLAADLLRERDALRAGVEAYRQQRDALAEDLRRAKAFQAEESEALADSQAEVERLRTQLSETGGTQAMARLNKSLTEQRDALADALLKIYPNLDIAEPVATAEAALRLAGRVPEGS